jgi:hypothetical protein
MLRSKKIGKPPKILGILWRWKNPSQEKVWVNLGLNPISQALPTLEW